MEDEREKMSKRALASKKKREEGLICHFIIFTASFAAEEENIGSLLAIITMNGHKNPTLFYDLLPALSLCLDLIRYLNLLQRLGKVP